MSRLEEPEECVDGVVLVGHANIVESTWWQVYVTCVTSNALRRLADVALKKIQHTCDRRSIDRGPGPSDTGDRALQYPGVGVHGLSTLSIQMACLPLR